MRRLFTAVAGVIAALSLTCGAYLMLPSSPEVDSTTTGDGSSPVSSTDTVSVIGVAVTISPCGPAYDEGLDVRQSAIRFTFHVTAPREAISFEL